jgi:DNA (cytosine-5)-methyltransferase 1
VFSEVVNLATTKRGIGLLFSEVGEASYGGNRSAASPTSLADILESDPTPRIPDYVKKRLDGAYRDRPIISDPKRGDIAPTCVAHYAKDLSTRLVADERFPHGAGPYTVREYARLQGVPDSFSFAGSENASYRMIGNGVSVPVGRWIGEEIARYFQ